MEQQQHVDSSDEAAQVDRESSYYQQQPHQSHPSITTNNNRRMSDDDDGDEHAFLARVDQRLTNRNTNHHHHDHNNNHISSANSGLGGDNTSTTITNNDNNDYYTTSGALDNKENSNSCCGNNMNCSDHEIETAGPVGSFVPPSPEARRSGPAAMGVAAMSSAAVLYQTPVCHGSAPPLSSSSSSTAAVDDVAPAGGVGVVVKSTSSSEEKFNGGEGGGGDPETVAALARLANKNGGDLPTHVAPTSVRNVKDFFLYEPCCVVSAGGGDAGRVGGELSWWMIPLKNRWFRSVFQLIPVFLVGSIVFSWQHYSGLLYASQAYLSRCTDSEIADYFAQGAIDQDVLYQPACRTQEIAVGRIYTINAAGEQVCGAIAGIIIDSWGPLSSACIGCAAIVISFILLLSATPATSLLYVFGSIFIGSGVNFIVYPAVVLGDLFPYHAPFMSALAIAIQVAGSFVTSALDLIHRHTSLDLTRILALLFFILVLPSLVFSTLSTPVKRIAILRRDQALLDREHARRAAVAANDTETLELMANEDRIAREAFSRRRPFLADLLSWDMALVAGICLISVIVYNYYPVILRDISGDAVARLNGYLLPTSAIWGTLYGVGADYFGTVICAVVLMFFAIAVYALILTHSLAIHYLATAIHTLGSACIFSVKFSYVVEMYQPQNQGRLLSSLAVVSGAALLLNLLVASFEDTRSCCIAMLVLCFPVLVMLYVLRRRTVGKRLVDLMEREKAAHDVTPKAAADAAAVSPTTTTTTTRAELETSST